MPLRDPKERIQSVAARLVHGNLGGLSWFAEDMPKTTPRKVLAMIEKAYQEQLAMASEIVAALRQLEAGSSAKGET